MKKILYHISLGLAMLLAACDDPNEGELFVTPTDLESEMSIIDVLERDSDYTMWIDFLKHANYYNALKDASSEATIFCPNNMAITAFLKNRGVSSVRDLPKNYARSVAQAHIIANTSITETTLNNYAESATYIPTQNLFGTYLTLKYGYTITDVDDA
ncbi:MAG: fasciclin domain-containing protein, partial [Prevotella sp.]|nr:fasciclin domain-containing protein [Prevotella sp.]